MIFSSWIPGFWSWCWFLVWEWRVEGVGCGIDGSKAGLDTIVVVVVVVP